MSLVGYITERQRSSNPILGQIIICQPLEVR
nr:MAG TPA: hypothetical protein [Caudoviricetes sp.]